MLRALLLDRMADDVRALRQANSFVEAAQKAGAPPLAHRDTGQPYRQVQNLFLGPPRTGILSATANKIFKQGCRGPLKQFSDTGLSSAP